MCGWHALQRKPGRPIAFLDGQPEIREVHTPRTWAPPLPPRPPCIHTPIHPSIHLSTHPAKHFQALPSLQIMGKQYTLLEYGGVVCTLCACGGIQQLCRCPLLIWWTPHNEGSGKNGSRLPCGMFPKHDHEDIRCYWVLVPMDCNW